MISGIRLKICGLTSLVDAEAADAIGADYLGFIFHPKSPRYIAPTQFAAMAGRLPPRRKVAVSVMPSNDELRAWKDVGIDAFQVHFPLETTDEVIAGWSATVGRDRLWLAPKLPPGRVFPVRLLSHAETMFVDTYAVGSYGGTGRTGDWPAFRGMSGQHSNHTWILAGGLSADTIVEALRISGARFVDACSGVELSPGIKDPAKLKALAAAMAGWREGNGSRQ